MRQLGLCGLAAITMFVAGSVTEAKASWTICNKTADNMRVAIAYVNPRGGFISEGWWTVRACGGCATVLQTKDTSDHRNVFYHAEGGGVIEGSSVFCVGNSPFKLNGKGSCAVKKRFLHKEINLRSHTTNITGRSASGRVCID